VASSTERLGILGGTYDPVHMVHLLLAQEAWYRYELSRVLFIPAAHNPLKPEYDGGANSDQRLAMLKLALERDTRFAVDAWELRQGGVSYSIDTLRRLKQLYRDAELYLILGADAALALPQWKGIGEYGNLCTLLICDRPGSVSFQNGLPPLLQPLGLRWELMPVPQLDISASNIRRRLRQGKPVRYFMPDSVADYIHHHGIYKN
jgi:nicotinate-nucleotide adenylyltransferase